MSYRLDRRAYANIFDATVGDRVRLADTELFIETVLELAASFGESAIAIAKRFNVRVVGIEKNPDSVIKARENIKATGLSD